MWSQSPRALLLVLAILAFISRTFAQPSNPSNNTNESVQVVDVIAKKYEFSPSPIRVKQGSTVRLKITAQDHTHGFRISEFPEGTDTQGKAGLVFTSAAGCRKIEEGQTATVEFVAKTPGTYPFKCCVHCGWHHGSMKGELIVEP